MQIGDSPPWSKNQLKKLGKSLLAELPVPAGCPSYNDVMLWHHELGAEVAETIRRTDWGLSDDVTLHVTSRGKTLDTLTQKLERSGIGLEAIQDLAGVRVDGNFNTVIQTHLAQAMADYFEVDERGIRDMRSDPHSGYRAVHLWVRCPAGRVEIQIRTEGQSEWANTYERLGDRLGRGIRYDEAAATPEEQSVVDGMHRLSKQLQYIEGQVTLIHYADELDPVALDRMLELAAESDKPDILEIQEALREADEKKQGILEAHDEYLVAVRELRRMIEDLEEVGHA